MSDSAESPSTGRIEESGSTHTATLADGPPLSPTPPPHRANPICRFAGAFLHRPKPIPLDEVLNPELTRNILKLLLPQDIHEPPANRRLAGFVHGLHNRMPEWGTDIEIAAALRLALSRGITHETWGVAMRSCVIMHSLLWEAPPLFAEEMQRMDPAPSAEMIASFEANMCQLGLRQRPVVAFIAGMLHFLLQLTASTSTEELQHIIKRGLRVRRHAVEEEAVVPAGAEGKPLQESTSQVDTALQREQQQALDMLIRCVTLQSYLTYLLSAIDLPLIAFTEPLAVTVLDRVVLDAKRIYVCIMQHVDHVLDRRFHRHHEVHPEDVAAWGSLFKTFSNSREKLAQFFERLDGTKIPLTEPRPTTLAEIPQDAVAQLEAHVQDRRAREHLRRHPADVNEDPSAAEGLHATGDLRSPQTRDDGGSSQHSDYPSSDRSPSTSVTITMPFANAPLQETFRQGTLTDTENDDSERADSVNNEFQSGSFDSATAGRYVLGNVLGKGAYGTVYRAFDSEEGHFVAVKELSMQTSREDAKSCLEDLQAEFATLSRSRDPNVVSVFGIDVAAPNPRIVMEWMPGGSVHAALKLTKRGFKESVVARYMRQAMSGLAYLHANSIVHRDIKPANMLLSATGDVKLSDFGTSRAVAGMRDSMQTGTVVGTIPYLAPECFKGTYSTGSDIWAMGCSALEMLTGQMPWSEKNTRDTLALVFVIGNAQPPNHHPEMPEVCSADTSPLLPGQNNDSGITCGIGTVTEVAHDFLKKCFTYDYKERPSAQELLQHPFLATAA